MNKKNALLLLLSLSMALLLTSPAQVTLGNGANSTSTSLLDSVKLNSTYNAFKIKVMNNGNASMNVSITASVVGSNLTLVFVNNTFSLNASETGYVVIALNASNTIMYSDGVSVDKVNVTITMDYGGLFTTEYRAIVTVYWYEHNIEGSVQLIYADVTATNQEEEEEQTTTKPNTKLIMLGIFLSTTAIFGIAYYGINKISLLKKQ